MGMIKRNEANKPTLMGVPVPGLVTPKNLNRKMSRIKESTGLTNKDLGAAAFGVGVIAAGVKAIKDSKKKKSNVSPPKSKPKFSNVQVPVGKPKQTRKPQTLKDEKGKAIIKKYTGGPKGYVPAYEMGRPSKVKK
mgnify:CR=1 FL=1